MCKVCRSSYVCFRPPFFFFLLFSSFSLFFSPPFVFFFGGATFRIVFPLQVPGRTEHNDSTKPATHPGLPFPCVRNDNNSTQTFSSLVFFFLILFILYICSYTFFSIFKARKDMLGTRRSAADLVAAKDAETKTHRRCRGRSSKGASNLNTASPFFPSSFLPLPSLHLCLLRLLLPT